MIKGKLVMITDKMRIGYTNIEVSGEDMLLNKTANLFEKHHRLEEFQAALFEQIIQAGDVSTYYVVDISTEVQKLLDKRQVYAYD